MLQKKNRLMRRDGFARLHKMGRFSGDKFLAIKYLLNKLEVTRVGFLVGLKISKKAVVRNKIRRRLREIFRLLIKNDQLKKGFDIVVLVRPEIVDKNYDEIKLSLEGVLKKAGLII